MYFEIKDHNVGRLIDILLERAATEESAANYFKDENATQLRRISELEQQLKEAAVVIDGLQIGGAHE